MIEKLKGTVCYRYDVKFTDYSVLFAEEVREKPGAAGKNEEHTT